MLVGKKLEESVCGESVAAVAGVIGGPPLPPECGPPDPPLSSEGVLLKNRPVPKSTKLIGELNALRMQFMDYIDYD